MSEKWVPNGWSPENESIPADLIEIIYLHLFAVFLRIQGPDVIVSDLIGAKRPTQSPLGRYWFTSSVEK